MAWIPRPPLPWLLSSDGRPASLTDLLTPAAAASLQWRFVATPGGPFVRTVDAPDARFFNLVANTLYTVNVECITPTGTRVQGLNTLTFKTPIVG